MKPKKQQKLETIARTKEYAHIRDIAGIPTAITDEHNESFYHWWNSGIKHATLLHVDAHADTIRSIMMKDAGLSAEDLPGDYYQRLTNSDFMCAAVYSSIVSSAYWLNPHARRMLTDIGSTKKSKNRKRLQTFAGRDNDVVHYRLGGPGERIVAYKDFKLNSQLILDIDLDAFCCHRSIERVPDSYKGVINYTSRIRRTIDFLRKLRRPDLITITRSQSRISWCTFVPEDKVDNVQKHLIKGLKGIY